MLKCPTCGKEAREDVVYCTSCGTKLVHEPLVPEAPKTPRKPRLRNVALFLAFVLGGFGLHHLYLGNKKMFYIQLGLSVLSFGVLLIPVIIWAIVEGLMLARNPHPVDAWGRPLVWEEHE